MADTNQDQTLSEAPLISSDPTPPSTETAPESVVKETEAAPAPARTSVTIAPAPATEEPPKQSEPVVASKAPSTIDLVEESKQPEPTPAPLPTTETTETKYGYLEKKEVYTKPNAILPEDSDLSYAKSFLKAGGDVNVYDHMTAIVMRMLETRPNNPIGKKKGGGDVVG